MDDQLIHCLRISNQTYIVLYIPLLRSALSVWTGGNWTDTSRLPSGFVAHYDLVRDAAHRRGREVLEFKLQDVWGPLYEFLEKDNDTPHRPFPLVNEGDFITTLHYIIFWMRLAELLKPWMIWLVLPSAAGALGWLYFK